MQVVLTAMTREKMKQIVMLPVLIQVDRTRWRQTKFEKIKKVHRYGPVL